MTTLQLVTFNAYIYI